MRQRLYAPQEPERFPASVLTPAPAPQIPAHAEGWAPPVAPVPEKRRFSKAALFLGIAAAFFVIALGAASYFLIFGGRSVSSDRISITVDGPPAVSSGDVVTLLVSIENRNPVTAGATMLSMTFPETTRSPEDASLPFTQFMDTVGDIPSGGTGEQSVRVALFGGENERVIIPIRFEYRVEGSNAVFVKEAEYEAVITSSPLSVRAEAVSESSVGQPLTFAVTVRSNAKERMDNIGVFAQYPFGFTAARGEGPVFPVGALEPGEERTITVSGAIAGENSDERVFRFTAGVRRGEEKTMLAVPYSSAEVLVRLAKPFLATTLSVNREASSSPVIQAGVPTQSIVSWVNTLATPILDGQVTVKLSGAALDTASVSAYSGFYRSSDTSIIYSRETESGLARLDPGATGAGSFSFRTKPGAVLAGMRNPVVTATISVAGRRVGETNVPESVSPALTRTIKVGTDLTLTARSLYSTGPFKNTGSWPPKVDQPTTYTIQLSLANTVNSVADATVSATLPNYVTYTGATSPADGSISYNAATRTVVWRAGEIEPGTGYGAAARSAAFQVSLLPSASQRGTSPILMSAPVLSGIDRFTQKQISETLPAVTTQASSDPAFLQGKAQVQ